MAETSALEIGPGENPLLPRLRKDLVGPGKKIFLERNRESVPGLKRRLEEIEVKNPEIIVGDISTLALNEKVGTIFAANVFSAQGIGTMTREDIARGRFGELNIGDEDKIVKQISGLLETGGKLVILESYGTLAMGKEALLKIFENNGFKIIETRSKADLDQLFDQSTDENMVEARTAKSISVDGSFAWVFKKE